MASPNDPFPRRVAGGFLIAAATMTWLGWVLMPHHAGTFFAPADFAAIHDRLHVWLWLYRAHLFGLVTAVLGLVALATLDHRDATRVLVWPGVTVACVGLMVTALANAFYYHHGVWGAIELPGQPAEAAARFVDALRVDTEYVTCLVRFGRVFTGLGLLVAAAGWLKGRCLPRWLPCAGAVLGVAAMALTMGQPDRLALYQPVFHAQALWFAAMGVVVWRFGLRTV